MTSDTSIPILKPYLSIPEIRQVSGRSRATVMRALAGGDLTGVQPCDRGRWSIPRHVVQQWIDSGCPVTPQDAPPASPASREGVITSCDAPRTGGGARPSSPPPHGVAVATRTHHGDATRAAS